VNFYNTSSSSSSSSSIICFVSMYYPTNFYTAKVGIYLVLSEYFKDLYMQEANRPKSQKKLITSNYVIHGHIGLNK
jgi:hypothetical protein